MSFNVFSTSPGPAGSAPNGMYNLGGFDMSAATGNSNNNNNNNNNNSRNLSNAALPNVNNSSPNLGGGGGVPNLGMGMGSPSAGGPGGSMNLTHASHLTGSTAMPPGGMNSNQMIFSTTPNPVLASGAFGQSQPPQPQPQQQQQQPFSLGMPPPPGSGAFGSYYMSAALQNVNLDSTSSSHPFDPKTLESINHTLTVLQDLVQGRHPVQWAELIDAEEPEESAARVMEALAKPSVDLNDAILTIAGCVTTPAHLQFVNKLEEGVRGQVRDLVLQEVLSQLEAPENQRPMPPCAEMLAEMSRLSLVRLPGVAATVALLLSSPEKRQAGIAVLGRVAERSFPQNEALLRLVQEKKMESHLLGMYREPEHEYDVLTITRLLGGEPALKAAVALRPVLALTPEAPVTALQYFRVRDELVSGQADGTVTVWGAPDGDGAVAPRLTLELPHQCVPIGMSGPRRGGQYLAVAGMPCTSASHPYYTYVEGRGKAAAAAAATNSHHSNSSLGGAPVPIVRMMLCSEQTGAWSSGEVLLRPPSATLTAVCALATNALCLAESDAVAADGPLRHDVRVLDPTTAQLALTLPAAHTDLITVLAHSEDNEQVLLSGGRDRVVKLWDTRAAAASVAKAEAAAPAHTLQGAATGHQDTISAIHTYRSFLFTGGVDGTLSIWDTRLMTAPVATRSFLAPVLGITAVEGGRMAVATARGMYLVSLTTMGAVDVLPNVCFTNLQTNDKGNVVFASGDEGISIMSLHKP